MTEEPGQISRGAGSPGRGWLKWAAVGIGGVVVIVIVAAIAVYFAVPGFRASEPENTAKFFPRSTLSYGWATFSPGIGQGRQMLDIWNRFQDIPEFEDAMDELQESFREETGLDLEDDVLPWAGPDMSFAVLDAGEFEPASFAVVVGVKDHDAASDFMDDWLDYLEEDQYDQYEYDEIDDFEVWIEEYSLQGYALSGDWLVYATTEDALEEVLDGISGDGGRTLEEAPGFQEARAAMQGDRLISTFMDLETAADALSSIPGADQDFIRDVVGIEGMPEWLATSARFVDRGLVVEVAVPIDSEFVGDFDDIGAPGEALPYDTLLFLAASFDPVVDNWRDYLDDYTVADLTTDSLVEDALWEIDNSLDDGTERELGLDSTLDEILDFAIDAIYVAIEIDLEEELFDYLAGRFILNVREFDFELAGDLEEYEVDIAAMLSYRSGNEEDLTDTMDKIVDLIEDEDLAVSSAEDIGADNDAVVFGVEDIVGESGYTPGYVLHDGYLTVGTTLSALEAIVDSQNGDEDVLADEEEYQRAIGHLPGAMHSLFFLDLSRLFAQLDPDDLDVDEEYYPIFEEGFGAIVAGSGPEGDVTRVTVALTLFPE